AVLMKGRQKYVFLNKVANLEKDGEYLIETEERAELKSLLQWSHTARDGSRSELSIVPKPSVWEKVACESDNCARVRCSFYNNCFFYNARREAAAADLLVANHHLLFADLAVRSETGSYTDAAILPGYSRIMLDEAHNVRDVATDYFGTQLSRRALLQMLGLLGEKASEAVLSQAVELSALTGRIESAASSLGEIFGKEDESKVRWIEMREGKAGKSFILRQVPLNVAGLLREQFFQKFET